MAATAGNRTANVTWGPAPDNGAAVTGYVVSWTGSNGAAGSTPAGPASRSLAVPNLVNGTGYTFSVRAANSAGQGPAVAASPVTPQGTPTATISRGRHECWDEDGRVPDEYRDSCYYMHLVLADFNPNTRYLFRARWDKPEPWSVDKYNTTDSNGALVWEPFSYYGTGYNVWIEVHTPEGIIRTAKLRNRMNAADVYQRISDNVQFVVRGKPQLVRLAVAGLLAEGHLLIEDVPGLGKTTLARCLARSIGGTYSRIQFTPDLLPGDVTGVQVYRQGSETFEFRPGGIFANIVVADEINRGTPKTQSALLEVMSERTVTVDSVRHEVPRPFLVIATQNPIEMEGTYRLPEAQLDRFLMRLSVGYPSLDAEVLVIMSDCAGVGPDELAPVVDVESCGGRSRGAQRAHRPGSASTPPGSPRPPASTSRCATARARAAASRWCGRHRRSRPLTAGTS